jgi:predicted phosphodiesterase
MDFVVLSDTHLEFYKHHNHPENMYFDHKCDTLIIAGDFGQPLNSDGKVNQTFIYHLTQLRKMYKYIVYVDGNHSYYRCLDLCITTKDVDLVIEKICLDLDIHYLQKSCWVHPETNVTFVGCTLWSQIDYGGKTKSNDFMRIFQNVNEYLELHNDHKLWLEETISQLTTPVIVVTHHLPSLKMVSDVYKHENNTAFATDLDYLIRKPIITWVCGHSHEAKTELINDIPVILNPSGYPAERQVSKRVNKVFHVEI